MKNALSEVIPAWLLPLLALVAMPNAIYFANPLDFGPPSALLLKPWLAAGTIAAALLLLLVLPARLRRAAVAALFWTGLFLALTDVLFPVHLGEVMDMGEAFVPVEDPEAMAIQAGLALALLVAAVKVPFDILRRGGTALVLFLIAYEAGFAAVHWPEAKREFVSLDESPRPPERTAPHANVYHLVFDSFSGYSFLDIARKTGIDDFRGFVFYPNNRSNYLYTSVSRASFLTGTLFEEGKLREWIGNEHAGGVFRELYDAGFNTWIYGNLHQQAVHTVTRSEFLPRVDRPLHTLLDLALLRLVPTMLEEETYNNGRGLATLFFGTKDPMAGLDGMPWSSLKLIERLIADERSRPRRAQYVHAHPYLPHFPYRLDADCGFRKRSTYEAQATCSVKLMQRFIRAVLEQGKFDDATIIIHADHGTWDQGPDLRGREADARMFAPYGILDVDHASRALLLIKPPRAPREPLKVSPRQTQLVDLRPTLQALLGLPRTPGPGLDVLAADFPADREAHVYPGFLQRDAKGRHVTFGKRIKEGTWRHFGFTPERGWQAYPDLHVKW